MKAKLILVVVLFLNSSGFAQQHFSRFRSARYKTIVSARETLLPDTLFKVEYIFSKNTGLSEYRIRLLEIKNTDSSKLQIYSNEKLTQEYYMNIPIHHIGDSIYVTDFNKDGRPDLKFFVGNTGNGLAALLSTKVYLFNLKSGFRVFSFFDFLDEKEYDLNGDGSFEILSSDHVEFEGHSYWVYNAFSFDGTKLVNVSKKIGYPLWTKHLYKTNKVVANISQTERRKALKTQPDDLIIYP